MKNIIIMGIGRAGKTTLSNMIKDKYNSYSLLHSDSLKWALIRAKGKEEYYRGNINKQKEFEHSEYFQKILLELFNSLIRNDKKQYGYILESGQLHPRLVNEMVDFKNTIVICLGLGNSSIDDMVNIKSHFEKNSIDAVFAVYSLFHLPDEDLRKVLKMVNQLIQQWDSLHLKVL